MKRFREVVRRVSGFIRDISATMRSDGAAGGFFVLALGSIFLASFALYVVLVLVSGHMA